MAHLTRFAPAFVVLALAACGGKSFDGGPGPDPDGGTDSGGSAQGGSGSVGGSAKGGTGHGGTGEGGNGATARSTCEAFDDQPGYNVRVSIINKTMAPIYLGQDKLNCTDDPLYGVQDARGATLQGPGVCSSSCQMLRDGDEIGCPAICAFPQAIRLLPGEVYYTTWNGLYQVQRDLPAACRSTRTDISCAQTVQIDPGTFTFSSVAGSSADCSETGGSCQPCMTIGNGGCVVPGSLISGERHKATATVYLDGAYGVWGRPTPAPLPLPDGDNSGAAPEPLSVELVFAD